MKVAAPRSTLWVKTWQSFASACDCGSRMPNTVRSSARHCHLDCSGHRNHQRAISCLWHEQTRTMRSLLETIHQATVSLCVLAISLVGKTFEIYIVDHIVAARGYRGGKRPSSILPRSTAESLPPYFFISQTRWVEDVSYRATASAYGSLPSDEVARHIVGGSIIVVKRRVGIKTSWHTIYQ